VRSLWLDEALRGETDAPVLDGAVDADVCIAGGGFTGLWTALRLKEREPALDVALVEADVCGAGASGRNGGFVLSWWAKFRALERLRGAEEALRLARASAAAVGEIGAFCEANGIDAHIRADGWLWTATSPAQIGAWDETIERLAELGEEPFERLEPEEVARRAASPRHLAGVYEQTAASVQPALLARGLRRVALARGVRIFEHSPVRRLERDRPAGVVTASGRVRAARVVLALNAWAAALPELRRALVVVPSDVIATPPIPDRLAEVDWHGGICIDDARLMVNYWRSTLDGRIVFGKGGGGLTYGGRIGPRYERSSPRADWVTASFHDLYPRLADVPAERSWFGPIDRSKVGLPFFGPLGGNERILVGAGYSGNGVGPSFLGGRILASLALGLDDEWAGCGLVRSAGGLPPEPIRYVGGRIVRAAVARKERAEDAGREPRRIDVFLAGLAPAALVPLAGPRARAPQVAAPAAPL
jgi:putative aminophosphonate oxidoreductase